MCGIQHIRSTAAKKSRVVPARCMYACTHRFLHLAATVEAICARAHFLRVFLGSLMNLPNRPKLWATPSRRFQQELHFARTVTEIMWAQSRFPAKLVQGTAWRSVTLQESVKIVACPRCTEFGCKIYTVCRLFAKLGFEVFILCADVCLHP